MVLYGGHFQTGRESARSGTDVQKEWHGTNLDLTESNENPIRGLG